MFMYWFFLVVLIGGAVALAVDHVWVLAGILIVMAVFGSWAMARYER